MSGENSNAINVDRHQLAKIREDRNETQKEFAIFLTKELGKSISLSSISKWESGTRPIPKQIQLYIFNKYLKPHSTLVPKVSGSANVIAVVNQKGGVGKTTTAVNLGYAMAEKGYQTLVLDMDPQANATMHFGIDLLELEAAAKTVYFSLLKDIALKKIIKKASDDSAYPLYVAPSSIALAAAEAELVSQIGNNHVLKDKLSPLMDSFDYIIIDCPPQLGMLTINALTAADWVLIPTQTKAFSYAGITQLFKTIELVLSRNNQNLQILGILPTMFEQAYTEEQQCLDDIIESYSHLVNVFPPILRSVAYDKTAAWGIPTLEAMPEGTGVMSYRTLAKDIDTIVRPEAGEVTNVA